ncbi:MAG TPA: PQQ-binding-like beta-propeller repeat protein [Kribbellaceae bacterium]
MELRDRWNHLLPDAKPLGEDLLARYAEPHRAYHDQRHLTEVLETIDALEDEAQNADTVRFAAWFHDAVYDPEAGPGENEEASAQLAEAELAAYGLDAEQVAEVGRLVRLTAAHHCDGDDRNGAVMCDADLRVLAAGEQRYDEYARDVRREYVHVGDRDFARGRAAILERIAEGRIYATDPAYEAWDLPARKNLDRELAELRPQTVNRWAGLVPLVYLGAALGLVVGAALLLGRGLAAAPSWPAPPGSEHEVAWWIPVVGAAAAGIALAAWARRTSSRVMLSLCAPIALAGAAGIAVSWARWPEPPAGTAMSERWPYLLLASIAGLAGGLLLAIGCRLRTATAYSGRPPLPAGIAVVTVFGLLLGWVALAAGVPFVEARLSEANTSSAVATAPPATAAPVRLDGELAWTRDVTGKGAAVGTAGGVAELRPDGVVTLDAGTGEPRWTYRRADVTGADGPAGHGLVVSADGTVLAVHLPADRRVRLPTYAVLDAVTGQVLAELHADGAALAVDAGTLVVADGDEVTGYSVTGSDPWHAPQDCPAQQAAIAGDTVVLVSSCGTPASDSVRGLAAADGRSRWHTELSGHAIPAYDASSPSDYRVGALAAIPGTRQVVGLGRSAAGGGTLYEWVVDTTNGAVVWSAPLPGSPRPGFGPQGCRPGLLTSRASLVVVACRAAVAGKPQVYDVVAANPADGTPQWHHLVDVPAAQQSPDFPAEGFALLPDGRVATLLMNAGHCAPATIGTTGVTPHPLTTPTSIACDAPRVTVAAGHPVVTTPTQLLALR